MEAETPRSSFQVWLDKCLMHEEKAEAAHRLRKEAQAHFESLCLMTPENKKSPLSKSSTVAQDISNASSSTTNGAMALLVSTLSSAFSLNNVPLNHKIFTRFRAVNCLVGASEGSSSLTYGVRQGVGNLLVELCRAETHDQNGDDEGMDSSDAFVDGSNLTSEEVTQQLEALDKAHQQRGNLLPPAEDVRDCAIEGLMALLTSRLDIFPTLQSQSPNSSSPVTEAIGVVHQSMELRMELAMLGLRCRCENDAVTSNYDNLNPGTGYETISAGLNVEGLSQLPQIKRSLCFNLLQAALNGLQADKIQLEQLISQHSSTPQSTPLPSSLLKAMYKFASLTSCCLHGETDPRCLLQLLRLLNEIQQIMIPLFTPTSNSATIRFPTVEVFDAVAPYYPVHFTPPKNDPHGITREMLQDALMAVLCERGAEYHDNFTKCKIPDDCDRENDSMTILSGRLFLDRLDPSKFDDYDPPSSPESEEADKLHALRDLSILLLPLSTESNFRVTQISTSFVRDLSSSLARAHEEAVSTDKTADVHSLASKVRKFASSFAYNLAPVNVNAKGNVILLHASLLWGAFVDDAIRRLAPNLSSSPQSMLGRSSTAYLASLAAEGGLPTLRKVLDAGLPRLLDLLTKNDETPGADDEKIAAALFGIGAFMSSCYIALQNWERDNRGVQVHPHPLSKYISSIIQKVAAVLKGTRVNLGLLTLAASGAFESALTSADLSRLDDEDLAVIENVLDKMSFVVIEKGDAHCSQSSAARDEDTILKWNKSCARALGAAIAMGFRSTEGNRANSCERLELFAQTLLPKCLASSVNRSSKFHFERYDWMVLAGACANGSSNVAEHIVPSLLSSTIDALQKKLAVQERSHKFECFPVLALAYLIRCGGPNVGKVFHDISSTTISPLDVIDELCLPLDHGSLQDENKTDAPKQVTRQLPVGMSHLQLPESLAKDEEIKNATVS